MQTTIGSHVSEDLLVRYCSGDALDPAAADLEEHILMCEICQSRLDAIDEDLRIAVQAAKELRQEARLQRKPRGLFWPTNRHTMLFVGALASFLICALVPAIVRHGAATHNDAAEVSLTATRGVSQTLVAHASTGKLTLKIDTSELPDVPLYRLQVVNASGNEIWSGTVASAGRQIRIAMPHSLGSGQYWIRLFGKDEIQLREFGLRVD